MHVDRFKIKYYIPISNHLRIISVTLVITFLYIYHKLPYIGHIRYLAIGQIASKIVFWIDEECMSVGQLAVSCYI